MNKGHGVGRTYDKKRPLKNYRKYKNSSENYEPIDKYIVNVEDIKDKDRLSTLELFFYLMDVRKTNLYDFNVKHRLKYGKGLLESIGKKTGRIPLSQKSNIRTLIKMLSILDMKLVIRDKLGIMKDMEIPLLDYSEENSYFSQKQANQGQSVIKNNDRYIVKDVESEGFNRVRKS